MERCKKQQQKKRAQQKEVPPPSLPRVINNFRPVKCRWASASTKITHRMNRCCCPFWLLAIQKEKNQRNMVKLGTTWKNPVKNANGPNGKLTRGGIFFFNSIFLDFFYVRDALEWSEFVFRVHSFVRIIELVDPSWLAPTPCTSDSHFFVIAVDEFRLSSWSTTWHPISVGLWFS